MGNSEATRTPGRVEKRQVAGWFSDDVARQLRMMAAEEDTTLQALLTEALNDLFRKRAEWARVWSPLEAQLVEALEAAEWSNRGEGFCPVCGKRPRHTHLATCKIALALKAARGEP